MAGAGWDAISSILGALVGAVAAAVIAYRQGRASAADEHDRDVEQRLRDIEFEVTDIRATIRERKGR